MAAGTNIAEPEARLDDFDPAARREALGELAALAGTCAVPVAPTGTNVNMHIHTFFSYNADGASPSRVAWEAKKAGLLAAGTVDFDVLDGMSEFLAACDLLGLRACVGVESRVFVKELADEEINSPGEPGISYYMGTGFFELPQPGSAGLKTLDAMRSLARRRNEAVAGRVNAHLGACAVDYERDVLPLAPSGNATERHMVAAYESKGRSAFPDADARAAYWAKALGEDIAQVKRLQPDGVAFRDLIRAKLMKSGGVGYVRPEPGSFPALEDMVEMCRAAGAIPTCTWLDGTSAGEADAERIVEFYKSKGAVALNIIPDRNWNLADTAKREVKTRNLHNVVRAARGAGLLICSGTERNKDGLPFVDDLAVEALAPIADDIREGALALVGHTAMARAAGRGIGSAWAREVFAGDSAGAAERNRFYAKIGRLLEPGPGAVETLSRACRSGESGGESGAEPAGVLAALR